MKLWRSKTYGLYALILFIICTCSPVFAENKSETCVQMVDYAIQVYKDKGPEYALKLIGAVKGPLIKREMYVFATDMNNIMLSHPYRKDLVGKDCNTVADSKGKLLFQEFKVTAENGSGWVDYYWQKPGEQGDHIKRTYIKRIPDENVYLGVGYYKDSQ